MPIFHVDSLDISVDEFLDSLTKDEMHNLIRSLSKRDEIFGYQDGIIDINEIYELMDTDDIHKMIEIFEEEEYLQEHHDLSNVRAYDEEFYEQSLQKLHGNWNRLTAEEEELINKIANRF